MKKKIRYLLHFTSYDNKYSPGLNQQPPDNGLGSDEDGDDVPL